MKTIFFIRHAKSDWSIPGLDDFDRPLNQRGYTDAHKMGRHLKKTISGKIVFVSSPAVRALSTALIIAQEINFPQNQIQLRPDLYEAKVDDFENAVSLIDDQFDTAFLFGHNPTISEVVGFFSGTTVIELPTCAVSVITFEVSEWPDILTTKGQMFTQYFPKSLT